jgi:uncharacterized protein YndB with AHSA1/START domain
MLEIDVRAHSSAVPEKVWAILSDTRTWETWAGLDEVTVEQGHEVGEIRRVRSGRIVTRERVTALEPPRRYVYKIVSGLPIRDYVAEVTLSPSVGTGTEIRWHSTFRARIPGTGWAIRRKLSRVIGQGAARLARVAEA